MWKFLLLCNIWEILSIIVIFCVNLAIYIKFEVRVDHQGHFEAVCSPKRRHLNLLLTYLEGKEKDLESSSCEPSFTKALPKTVLF